MIVVIVGMLLVRVLVFVVILVLVMVLVLVMALVLVVVLVRVNLFTANTVKPAIACLQQRRQKLAMSDQITKILTNRNQVVRVVPLHDFCDGRSPFSNGSRFATARRGKTGGTAWVVGEFPTLR